MSTGSGLGRFVAERGLYCLPTGRRFELAGEIAQILARRVDDAHEKRPHGAFASVIQPTY